MNIKIVDYKKHESGKLKGFADIQILDFGLTIQGCKFFQNNKDVWIKLPDKEYTNREGERRWQSFLTFSADVDKAFQNKTMAALREYLDAPKNTPAPEPYSEPEVPF